MLVFVHSPLFAIAFYTFLEALRNRLFGLVVVFLVAGFGLAEFTGELAIIEAVPFQSGFLGAVLRLFAVFVVSLFVITSMVREFNDKGLELVLSLPITRRDYFFGKLAGFSVLAMLTALLCSLCLLVYVPWDQVLLWGLSLTCELLIVTVFSLFCLFTLNQVTLALSAVMGFYVLSRGIAAFQLMSQGPLADTVSFSQQFINALINGIAFLLPELHRFTATEWLVYHTGAWQDLAPIAGQSAIYLVLLAGAALFDFYRKNL